MGFLVAQWYRICLPIQETQVQSLDQEDPLKKDMATHSNILAWEIPWTEEPGSLQFMGSQRIGYDLASKYQEQQKHIHIWHSICTHTYMH